MIDEGPFKTILDKTEGVLRKEIINYVIRNGQLIVEKGCREYLKNNDYNDTTRVTPICKAGE